MCDLLFSTSVVILTYSQAQDLENPHLITYDKKGQKQCQIDDPFGAFNNFHI